MSQFNVVYTVVAQENQCQERSNMLAKSFNFLKFSCSELIFSEYISLQN